MKGSLIVLLFFMAGCLLGVFDIIPLDLQKTNLSMYILYAIMLQVGLSIGSSKDLKSIIIFFAGFNPKSAFFIHFSTKQSKGFIKFAEKINQT